MQNKAGLNARGLLLDLDGTLVDSHAAVERSWRRWAAGVGVTPESFLHTVHGRPGHEVMAEVLPGRPVEANHADSRELLAWELRDTAGVRALPGASELLELLAGWPWAVVTACPETLAGARLAAAGLPRPEVLVTADQLTVGKPDPQGFLLAARRLSLEPAGCVVFEDAPAGVAAGLAAGMAVVGLGAVVGTGESLPTLAADRLDQVRVTREGTHLRITVVASFATDTASESS
jgi:sugar-phosphatase